MNFVEACTGWSSDRVIKRIIVVLVVLFGQDRTTFVLHGLEAGFNALELLGPLQKLELLEFELLLLDLSVEFSVEVF
jgi:hypothetical protein